MDLDRSGAAPASVAAARILVDDLWARLIDVARREAAAEEFVTWLRQLRPQRLEQGTLFVGSRGRGPTEYLRHRYTALLERLVARSHGVALRVSIERDQSLGAVLRTLRMENGATGNDAVRVTHDPSKEAVDPPASSRSPRASSAAGRFPVPAGVDSQAKPTGKAGLALGSQRRPPPPYRVVPETRLVHDALRRLALGEELESHSWTIVGPAGVGKSHLLDSFLHRRSCRFPFEKWERWSGLSLFAAYSASCRERRIGEFRGRILANDGLVVEDVHEVGAKLHFQEFVAQVLEYFRARRRPVLLSARHLPGGGKEFLTSFRSRLLGGCTLHIPRLPTESRLVVLEERCASRSVPAWFLEEAASSNRSLRSCIDAAREVRAIGLGLGRVPRHSDLISKLPQWFQQDVRPHPMDSILQRCAEHVGVDRESIVGGDRSRSAALGRHLVVYAALEICRVQRATLKQWLGRLSPSVVPYARRRIEALREKDPKLDPFLRRLSEEVLHGQQFLF